MTGVTGTRYRISHRVRRCGFSGGVRRQRNKNDTIGYGRRKRLLWSE